MCYLAGGFHQQLLNKIEAALVDQLRPSHAEKARIGAMQKQEHFMFFFFLLLFL